MQEKEQNNQHITKQVKNTERKSRIFGIFITSNKENTEVKEQIIREFSESGETRKKRLMS